MSDLIRREDVFKTLGITDKSTKYGGDHSGYNTLMLYEIMDAIDSIPTAEPKEGEWIDKTEEKGWPIAECSVCGSRQGMFWMNFCPHCGARMKGE